MRKDLVKYQDDDYNVEIVVGQATIAMGLKRSDLWFDTRTSGLEGRTLLSKAALLQTYPSSIAATLSVTNLPKVDGEGKPALDEDGNEKLYPKQLVLEDLTLALFLELPEALGALWQEAVFGLNPHWLPEPPEEEEDEEGEAEEPSKEIS